MSDQHILILGGAGYIGSQTNLALLEKGFKTIVLDNLKSGHTWAVPTESILISADLSDVQALRKVFKNHEIIAVMHFAACIEVAEGQVAPEKFYFNNVVNTLNILQVMREFNVDKIVFSSTAAVYGLPRQIPILEDSVKLPINTYGRTKWMMEQILHDYHRAYALKSISLRYFNACGADLQNRIGEAHDPESHLIPLVLQTANERRKSIKIYGDNYSTPDGTCIRDYIHVVDLAEAHILALQKLLEGKIKLEAINLGTKNGFSVKEIIETAKKITKQEIKIEIGQRRPGDPDILIADNQKALNLLGWQPKYSDLETIISTAWNWEQKYNTL